MNEDIHALFAVLCCCLAETSKAGDAVPAGVHAWIVIFVAHHATVRETGTRDSKGEVVILRPPWVIWTSGR